MTPSPAPTAPLRAVGARLLGWPRRSIGGCIVTLSLGLVLVLQGAAFFATGASVARHARSQLPGQLDIGERVLQSLLDQQAHALAEDARRLAADDALRSAVLANDSAAVAALLARHGPGEVALLGTDHGLRVARGHEDDLKALLGRLRPLAEGDAPNAEIALLGGQPHQVVRAPMKAPAGWVLVAVPLDARLAQRMNALSALNVTVLTRGRPGESWVNALSGLPAEQADALARAEWPAGRRPSTEPGGLRSLDVGTEELGVRARWLTPEAGAAAARPAVLAVLSLSVDAAVRPPRDLETCLLGVTLFGCLLAVGGSLLAARRVARPLRTLAGAAERLGAGDCDSPMPELGRQDEIGHLAQAFDGMRANVADRQQQTLQLAYWDPLTGLPNRVQFRDAVHRAIQQAQAAGHPVAVVMLDLDRFKHVNDVLGHAFGDLLLKQVAQRLSQHGVRGDDLVARLGGDEFAVLLRQGGTALAETVAQRIGKAFEQPLVLQEHTVDMGAGIGMACWPQHAADADADLLLGRAEVAMCAAKRRAAGPLMYDASIDAGSALTLSLLAEMRHAVDHGELCLYLQPKLSLDTGRVTGAEALVRWQHPQRGLLPPLEFIPFAEQTGFVRVLTQWVFEAAARAWLALRGDGLSLPLSVNLSTRDLLDQELPQKFDALLVKHRVPAEAFCLEVTERAIMDDPQRALATLNRLSGLGFRLSIDDFGTGCSSLATLKRLPVDELKIDKSFVMGMERDAEDAKIVRSTIDLAHNFGLTVVAEGVESARAWDLLRELECDQAQGYHMGQPMPVEQFQLWSAGWLARYAPASLVQSAVLH